MKHIQSMEHIQSKAGINGKTIAELCLASSAKYKGKPAFALYSEGRICREISYEKMGTLSLQISRLLRQLGVTNGSRVLLLSENCPEWPLAYFGIALAKAVSVPLLTGFSGEQIRHIALHSEISAICLSRSMIGKFSACSALEEFSQIPFIYIDNISTGTDSIEDKTGAKITVSVSGTEKQIILPPPEENIDLSQYNPNDLSTIIYTSGTSENSKGVMLSGKNVISSALLSISFTKIFPHDRILSTLPLGHCFECCIGLLVPVISGASITYLDKPPMPSVVLPALKKIRPTVMITVPLLVEKIYHNFIKPKLLSSRLFNFFLTRPLVIHAAGRKLISELGGCIRLFGIGGAPLSAEVEQFLHRAKFPYSLGYGLTEAAPFVCGNTPRHFPINSAGMAPKGVSLRVAKCEASRKPGEGEVQIRGPNIMMGYYKDEKRTGEAFTPDGWLRTGDLGRLDKKGRLFIIGRIKALILGPSGENIYPEEIEDLLGCSPIVEDALVYSGSKGELVALVRLSDAARAAADTIEHTLEELRSWVNKKLAVFSRLSRIELRHEPFEKTPTMKIKRYLYL